MKLYIKYMVSRRCIMMVKCDLDRTGIQYSSVDLGVVETAGEISEQQKERLSLILLESGLELMRDEKAILIEKIRTSIIVLIHHSEGQLKVNFSNYLSEKLNHNYTYLANIFSEAEGITIEHFMIIHKIERVKELILYGELTITEIAWILHYSSVAHLSSQFKKITGFSPSIYKLREKPQRNNLENI